MYDEEKQEEKGNHEFQSQCMMIKKQEEKGNHEFQQQKFISFKFCFTWVTLHKKKIIKKYFCISSSLVHKFLSRNCSVFLSNFFISFLSEKHDNKKSFWIFITIFCGF